MRYNLECVGVSVLVPLRLSTDPLSLHRRRYGKIGATTAEIEAAAKSAQIHDRILSFPDGYASLVGERGVKVRSPRTAR